MSKSVDKTKLEIGSHPPIWCRELSAEEENTIRDVFKFFVVNTPCKDISAMSIPLTRYGWDDDTPQKDGYLQRRLMDAAGLKVGVNLFIGDQREDMKALFSSAAMDSNFGNLCCANRIAILINGNFILELFRNLRNSFAHCRFTIKKSDDEIVFIMENGAVSGVNCEVKSRMILKKSTLEEWISIIENEAATERAILKAEHEKLKAQIVATVTNGDIKSISQMAEVLGVEEKVITNFTREHKSIIEYSRHDKKWVLCASEGVEDE